MLVLSRRPNQAITFPGSDTKVRVLSAKANLVRLGIEAPPEVVVMREELLTAPAEAGVATCGNKLPQLVHLMRERLQATATGLGTAHLLLNAGCESEAGEALFVVRDDLQQLRFLLDEELECIPSPKSTALRKGKALLVEDDGNQRELLAGLLRMAGMEVATAGDGADALDHLHKYGKPDVVLLDMGLPRCDGATAVRRIRHDPALAGLHIVAVTGSSPDEYDLPHGAEGIDRWCRKPIDPASLIRELTQELSDDPCLKISV